MKKIVFAFIAASLMFVSCGPGKVSNPYSTSEVVSHNTQGSVTLRGVGNEVLKKETGKYNLEKEAVKAAHKKAIQQLFYLGYVGTDFKNPWIRKGEIVETTNKAFFDKFWDTGYQRFITDSKDSFYGCQNIGGDKCISAVSVFTVNYNMLRKELENNKIINTMAF